MNVEYYNTGQHQTLYLRQNPHTLTHTLCDRLNVVNLKRDYIIERSHSYTHQSEYVNKRTRSRHYTTYWKTKFSVRFDFILLYNIIQYYTRIVALALLGHIDYYPKLWMRMPPYYRCSLHSPFYKCNLYISNDSRIK